MTQIERETAAAAILSVAVAGLGPLAEAERGEMGFGVIQRAEAELTRHIAMIEENNGARGDTAPEGQRTRPVTVAQMVPPFSPPR